jgi:saccharopine dehydrogenase-like NADP-dependent oxidoreductase
MKVLALGGSGHYGQVAVKTILKNEMVDRLVVADHNFGMAASFVESLNDHRVSACGIDIRDQNALEWLMSSADIVMNTVGPYFRFGVQVIRSAIKMGRHYVDIMDDPAPTKEALKLHDEARKAGVTVLIGMGASPGLTSILAKHGMNQLDTVTSIQTVWGYVGGMLSPGSALLGEEVTAPLERTRAGRVHMMYCASRKAPILRQGRFIEIVPLEDGEEVVFPQGKGFFNYLGHAEPVTLPHFVSGLEAVCNLVGLEPEALDVLKELASRIRAGELSEEEAAAAFSGMVTERKRRRPDKPSDTGPRVGGWHASVSGEKQGRHLRLGYGFTGEPPGAVRGATGIPLALGAEMIMKGEIAQHGVLAPEACIDPIPFIKRYIKFWEKPPSSYTDALYEVTEEI